MKYLFLDTNIYLHYTDYEQLDWEAILSTADDVTIVVPPIVRAEIDKMKDKGSGKVSNKARDIAKRFREVFLDKTQRKIPIIVCSAPKSADYKEYDLDKEVQDNQFILSAILFKNRVGEDVIVISGDMNPLMTAEQYGLTKLYLPDVHKLKPEPSKEEKELQELKKEFDKYVNRFSKPRLMLDNWEGIIKLTKPTPKDIELEILEAIGEEKMSVPFHNDNPLDNSSIAALSSSLAMTFNALKPRPEEIERYNREVEEYHVEFNDYIRIKLSRDELLARMYKLKFIMHNNGNAPTGDLDIFIDIPHHVKLYDHSSKKYFDVNNPPIKPAPPSSFMGFAMSREHQKQFAQAGSFHMTPYGYVDNRPKIWDLDKPINAYSHHIDREPLSQTLHYEIGINDGLYIDLMQCGNFAITYSIVDTSLPEPIEGMLNVVVE